MKIALCFSGLVRTFAKCFPSYDRILTKYDCDLYAVSTPNDVLQNYPFKKILLKEDEWIDEKQYNEYKNQETIIQNTLRQFQFIELCNNLAVESGVKYEYIIRTRLDNLLINDIPDLNHCNPNSLHIPEGHDHPMAHPGVGINDRFGFGGSHVMQVYSNKLGRIDEYMASGKRFHPETILMWAIKDLNIVRFQECTKINRGNNELL